MNLLKSQNRIIELMSRFVFQVNDSTAMSRTDINKASETILRHLLAEVYDYTELKNLNSEKNNYPGIDLGDEKARVAIQITSTSDNEKIKDTLRKFVKYKLYEKYDKLIIYILTEKQGSYTGSGHKDIIQDRFTFDKDKDIIDRQDIIKEVANLQDIEKVRRIENILEANFGETRTAPEREVADKVQQIINDNIKLFVGR
ncbi:SMEK domain-containing protein, partial [Trichormus variabilis]|uniref:SMEK domain-containing protein n=1 Tax=Anabaena variabilis TaxID=264691 RepID=UPI0011D0A321